MAPKCAQRPTRPPRLVDVTVQLTPPRPQLHWKPPYDWSTARPRRSWGRHDWDPPTRTMADLGIIASGALTIVPIDRWSRGRDHAGWWGQRIAGRRHDREPTARTAQYLRVVTPRPMAIVPIGRRGAWGPRAGRWR